MRREDYRSLDGTPSRSGLRDPPGRGQGPPPVRPLARHTFACRTGPARAQRCGAINCPHPCERHRAEDLHSARYAREDIAAHAPRPLDARSANDIDGRRPAVKGTRGTAHRRAAFAAEASPATRPCAYRSAHHRASVVHAPGIANMANGRRPRRAPARCAFVCRSRAARRHGRYGTVTPRLTDPELRQ